MRPCRTCTSRTVQEKGRFRLLTTESSCSLPPPPLLKFCRFVRFFVAVAVGVASGTGAVVATVCCGQSPPLHLLLLPGRFVRLIDRSTIRQERFVCHTHRAIPSSPCSVLCCFPALLLRCCRALSVTPPTPSGARPSRRASPRSNPPIARLEASAASGKTAEGEQEEGEEEPWARRRGPRAGSLGPPAPRTTRCEDVVGGRAGREGRRAGSHHVAPTGELTQLILFWFFGVCAVARRSGRGGGGGGGPLERAQVTLPPPVSHVARLCLAGCSKPTVG